MLSDIEIAQQTELVPIDELATRHGLSPEEFEPYGRDKAKLTLKGQRSEGRLILVTATSGMPAGSGKTTTSIALAQGLKAIGEQAVLALREPSLGPVFGMKGGAAGGGYSQVLPMEAINLHFTGDFHAITAANNLLAALIDNARLQGQITLKEVYWKRVLDCNDRMLRHIVTGLGGAVNGIPTETGFDITAASELMAILCLTKDSDDLRARIDEIVVGLTPEGEPVRVKTLGCTGSLVALLLEALKPNLVQSIEGNLALVHGGPFANIAHGCNSLIATKTALALGDYVVTEAGFGSDLGAEKFFNIKARVGDLKPAVVVLVTSTKALKWHGGAPLAEIGQPSVARLQAGFVNLQAHLDNLAQFGPKIVVSVNRFHTDTDEELAMLVDYVKAQGHEVSLCEGFAKGGAGATDLAQKVKALADAATPTAPHYSYALTDSIEQKINAVVQRVYGGQGAKLSPKAQKDLAQLEAMGYGHLPICIAKTPYSLSADPSLLGAPKGFTVPVARLILNAGAGFIVVTTGDIMRMPGLPKAPAAMKIDVQNGRITGLA